MGIEFDFCGDRIYIDANIFIYAVEGYPRFTEIAGTVLGDLEDGMFQGVTSELTIAEVLVVPLRDRRQEIAHLYQELLQSGGALHVVPVTRRLLIDSVEFRAKAGGRLADNIHVATAVATGCDFFLSEDRSIRLPQSLRPLTLSEFLDNGAEP